MNLQAACIVVQGGTTRGDGAPVLRVHSGTPEARAATVRDPHTGFCFVDIGKLC